LLSARVAADRVRVAFEEAAREIDGLPTEGTVSIGASATENADCDIAALLAMADKALYAAKSAGRNRTVTFGSAEEQAVIPTATGAVAMPIGDRRGNAIVAPSELALAIATARAALRPAA
jgi:predicted signal transduction protein with EAL and GGDEF domain